METTVKPRKFTIQLTLQELDVIEGYLREPGNQRPWPAMADALGKRARTWRAILKKETA